MFKQVDGAAIDKRQQVPIEVRLGFLCRLIIDSMLAELFPWPFAAIPITVNLRAAIRPDASQTFEW